MAILNRFNNISIDSLECSMDIFKKLLQGDLVGLKSNNDLYEKYRTDSEIEHCLRIIAKKLDIEIYEYEGELYLTTGVNNKIFGYSNEELKKQLSYVRTNDELYLAYFIMYVILILFYKESNYTTAITYISIDKILEKCTNKLDALIRKEDIEEISKEYSFNFTQIASIWDKKPEVKEIEKGGKVQIAKDGKESRYQFVNLVCSFLKDEKLITIDNDRNLIFPTNRFKAIVYYYFQEQENKSEILEFIDKLNEEEV